MEDWIAVRERIAGLQAVKCRLVHERARLEDGLPLRIDRGGPEQTVERVGLCSIQVRRTRLACGHTTARYALAGALQSLLVAQELSDAAFDALWGQLSSTENSIHQLDHQKGDAEKKHAFAIERKTLAARDELPALVAAERTIAAEIQGIEHAHDACVDEMLAIRDRILQHLDAVIARQRAPVQP